MEYQVLYWNPSTTPELRRIVELQLPASWSLTIPGQDGPPEKLLPQCDFMVVADRAVTASDLAQANRLRMIQHQGVGYERIDLTACRERGVLVALTPEGTTAGVAEHTILLILAVYKQLLKAATGVRNGSWMQWELRQDSFELAGKTLGLVGFGRIGQAVAQRASAFEANIQYFDPFVTDNSFPYAQRAASLETLLNDSDIVSLHLPGSASSHRMIGKSAFDQMRSQAVLINTSRGSLIDEQALYAACVNRQIAGAALDVLEQEPARPTNPLLALDNVLVTPHIAAGTVDAFRMKMRAVFANLVLHSKGLAPRNVVPEMADRLEQLTDLSQ